MNRQFRGIFFILLISVLIACIPAGAVQNGQSGGPSSTGGYNSGADVATGPSAGYSSGPSSNFQGSSAPGPAASGISSGESRESIPGDSGASFRGDLGSRSSSRSPGQADFATGGSGRDQPGAPTSPHSGSGYSDTGSGRGTTWEKGAGAKSGNPDDREHAGGEGSSAGMVISPAASGFIRSHHRSDGNNAPIPYSGRSPAPHRQQQGSPAQSGNYPCGPAQTNTIPSSSGHTENETKEDPASRKRPRRSGLFSNPAEPPVSIPSASAPPLLFPFSLLFFGGYRRISKKNVLEHAARNALYQAITNQPGIEVKRLSDLTGINENTLRYHLARLVASGKITCFIRHGVVRYFRNQAFFSQSEQMVFHYLWSDTPRAILWLLSRHPGLTRQQIADVLAISGPSVTRQMEHLIEDGIVENRLTGRSNHYSLTEEAATTLNQLRISPPAQLQYDVGRQIHPIPAG